MSDSLRPHEPQPARPPCPSRTPTVHPNPCPSSWWCHPAISSSVVPFSSCPQIYKLFQIREKHLLMTKCTCVKYLMIKWRKLSVTSSQCSQIHNFPPTILSFNIETASQVTLVAKSLPASAEDTRHTGSIPGSGRSPGEGNGNPLQHSCLKNSTDAGAWQITVRGVQRVRQD